MMNITPEDWVGQPQTSNKAIPPAFEALRSKIDLAHSESSLRMLNGCIEAFVGESLPRLTPEVGYYTAEINFPNWAKDSFKEKMEQGLTTNDLDAVMEKIGGKSPKTPVLPSTDSICFESVSEKKRSVEETKKLITNFKEKVANYPKHLSYEGSVVLCVMLSMEETAFPNITNLPMVDQTLIRSSIPPELLSDLSWFEVAFDQNKDFVLKFKSKKFKAKDNYEFTMFNSVAHPRPEDLKDVLMGSVPVEKDGDEISIGGKIKLNPKTVRIVMGTSVPPVELNTEVAEEKIASKRPVAGRNAFEIREDILECAIDVVRSSGKNNGRNIDELSNEILRIASKFYAFVEDRRRR